MKDIFGDLLIIINKHNLKKYVLKLPPYFHRIPKIAIKVDYIRIALLYYHGGCYLDAEKY
jgi:mannosyltransferase OCH1-like enzyme